MLASVHEYHSPVRALGTADSHAQFDLANGTFFDEDLEVGITHSATPSAGTFTQVLQGNAEIPVYYMSGSEGEWVKDTATEFACKQSATTLQYNSLNGSTWSTTAANVARSLARHCGCLGDTRHVSYRVSCGHSNRG